VIVLWAVLLVVGIAGAALGSRRAVPNALAIADALGVSKGLIGVTLVAVGTDLPEIANSISSSVTGHGDVNVGDSTGSALTQVTLVLAILTAAAGGDIHRSRTSGPDAAERDIVVPVGVVTFLATLLIALLVADGALGRVDGATLVGVWAIAMVTLTRWHGRDVVMVGDADDGVGRLAFALLAWLALVGTSSVLVVRSFVELTDAIGVPELIASAVVLAIGTSFPELVVDWTAIRSGATALAFGDLFGSSLVDASLSIGIGPVIRPTSVSAAAVASTLVIAAGIAAATWVARPAGTAGGRATAASLVSIYVACTLAMVAAGSV
jgi:cation:H+ antiporter